MGSTKNRATVWNLFFFFFFCLQSTVLQSLSHHPVVSHPEKDEHSKLTNTPVTCNCPMLLAKVKANRKQTSHILICTDSSIWRFPKSRSTVGSCLDSNGNFYQQTEVVSTKHTGREQALLQRCFHQAFCPVCVLSYKCQFRHFLFTVARLCDWSLHKNSPWCPWIKQSSW